MNYIQKEVMWGVNYSIPYIPLNKVEQFGWVINILCLINFLNSQTQM